MGLDVHFFEAIEVVGPHATSWIDESGVSRDCDHQAIYTSGHFPRTEVGLTSGVHFEESGLTEHWSMPYMAYSRFRAVLLNITRPDLVHPVPQRTPDSLSGSYYPRVWTDEISYAELESWPFNELINFSDCEGAYGPEVAAKLLKDFRDHEDRVYDSADHLWPMNADPWVKAYRRYMEGLAIVGPKGLVTYG